MIGKRNIVFAFPQTIRKLISHVVTVRSFLNVKESKRKGHFWETRSEHFQRYNEWKISLSRDKSKK